MYADEEVIKTFGFQKYVEKHSKIFIASLIFKENIKL